MAQFKEYISKLKERTACIEELFGIDELIISFDRLKKEKEIENDLLYFKFLDKEIQGMFVFGSEFFQRELSEQEFKKILGQNSMNFKILMAYKKVHKRSKKVKISEILNELQDQKKDSIEIHKYLSRILTLAYYYNWEMKKDIKDIEGDCFIEIPDKFLIRLKQRYDFSNLVSVYENEDVFIFVNSRGKLNLVFKNRIFFSRKDVENEVYGPLKNVFDIKKITGEIDF